MDEHSGIRVTGGFVVPRKGSALILRETGEKWDRNMQLCSLLGCNERLNHTKGNQMGSSEKPKSSRSSFHSNGKEIIGSFSKTYSMVTAARKNKFSSQQEMDSSETSSIQDEPETLEFVSSSRSNKTDFQSELEDAESCKASLMEVGSSSVASNTRHRKIFHQKSILANQDSMVGSPISLASKAASQEAGSSSNAHARRYGLRNRRCNSISDVIPQGNASLESDISRRRDVVKKRNPEGERDFSFRGKEMSGQKSSEAHTSLYPSGISMSGSQRARNWPPSRDGIALVRNQSSMNANTRGGLSNQLNRSNYLVTKSDIVIAQVPQPEIPINMNMPCPAEASSCPSSYYGHIINSGNNLSGTMPSPAELGISCLMNDGGMKRYNMDGITEVLLALERIERDEELAYEQLLVLETNVFFGGLNLYDQHREMRLDIDNMSYEELLDLEERMGFVSTALSQEELSKCISRSIYRCPPSEEGAKCSVDGDDIRCIICQEEYLIGDEVGKLECEHGYHLICIQQWLRLKNWCPICKASAAPSPSSSVA